MVETRAGGKHELDLGNIQEDIIAAVDDKYDLGSEDKRWAYIWVAIAMVTSLTIGGVIGLSNVDSWLYINASTYVNGSMNISEDLNVSGTLTAGSFDITNLTIENMNFTNLTLTGDIFNISATETYVNDLFPNEYCTSDLGSIGLRWDNGYFCHNVSAEYFVGDGSHLTNLPAGSESDPIWSSNYSIFLTHINWSQVMNGTLAELSTILGFSYYNSTDFEIADYYLLSNPFGFYNSTNPQTELDPLWSGNQSSYFNTTEILGFSYYNSTDFEIADYYLLSNPFGFYNSTTWNNPFSYWNSTFATFNKTYADTLYYGINNPYSFYNSTNPQTETDPLWSGNETNVAFKNEANVFTAGQNLTGQNITAIDCIIFDSGGKICSGV